MHPSEPLNPKQTEAVHHDRGPILVLAGPGSGKTRVLTHRIAWLVREKRVDPASILAITFTNKAAEEMRLRVQRLLGPVGQGMWIGTFHGTCARILRRHVEQLGFQRNFVIYDDGDQLRVIRACLKARGTSEKAVRPSAIQSVLDRAKNQAVAPREVALAAARDREVLCQLMDDYAAAMKQANAMDFGDLIVRVLDLLGQHPDLAQAYRSRFPFILVDEYQDTNRAQHLLLRALAAPGTSLCVVGDDDQAIYRWRGAEVENMLSFERDFPGCRVITLEQNYRSTGNILGAAQAVARENPKRMAKELWTANPPGPPLVYFEGDTQETEAAFVAREIGALVDAGAASFGDVGIFYRTNAQSRALEESLLLAGIPYKVVGSLRFYERAEIKDLMGYLRVLYNPRDSVALLRILNRPPRGIGATTQERISAHAAETGQTVWDALATGPRARAWTAAVGGKLERFRQLLLGLSETLEQGAGPADLLRMVIRSTGYDTFLDAHPDADRRRENVDELIHTASAFAPAQGGCGARESLGAFCERIALVTGADTADGRVDGVTLMTLHCAKGLEFSVVFLTGMENGLLPHQRSMVSEAALAEERRLCYVGMTRARERLYLSRARMRAVYGERRVSLPSPFLLDIPPERVQHAREPGDASHPPPRASEAGRQGRPSAGSAPPCPTLPALSPPPGAPPPGVLYRVGDRVVHHSLGEGTVYAVERAAGRDKIVVRFAGGQIRKLMAHVAPIRKMRS